METNLHLFLCNSRTDLQQFEYCIWGFDKQNTHTHTHIQLKCIHFGIEFAFHLLLAAACYFGFDSCNERQLFAGDIETCKKIYGRLQQQQQQREADVGAD